MQWLVQGTTSYLLKKTEESISNIINAPPGSTERPQQQQPVAHQQSGSGAVASGQPKWHCHARHSDHGSQLAIRVLTVAEQWLDQWDITWCTGGILILSLWRPSPRRKMRKRSLPKRKPNWRAATCGLHHYNIAAAAVTLCGTNEHSILISLNKDMHVVIL